MLEDISKLLVESKYSLQPLVFSNITLVSEERRIEKAKLRITELECELEALDKELFGEAATNYQRAAEIEERKNAIEEELLELYEIVM